MASSRDCKTQEALARKSGVGQSTIGRILRGEVNPQTSTMTFIARALRVSLKTLAASAESVDQPEVDRALLQALAYREDRRRAEQTLVSLRRQENDAIERLQELVLRQDAKP
jgi:transcriptional regulator with XRE-family HTH domain